MSVAVANNSLMYLRCGTRRLDLSTPQVMGILNVTPDSFSDGGQHASVVAAYSRAQAMVAEGAAIIDVGGESTRPGAQDVTVAEELDRVIPVVERVAGMLDVIVSVDTSKPEVMRAALAAGASMVNDVMALRVPGAIEVVMASQAAVCLMHMQGKPRTMQAAPDYRDVVAEVGEFLAQRVKACQGAGMECERIVIDPGFGFGKSLEHNVALLAGLSSLAMPGIALLAGFSRKSMIGQLTGRAVGERLAGSTALAALAVMSGVAIVRAHDVAATVDAIKVAAALRAASGRS